MKISSFFYLFIIIPIYAYPDTINVPGDYSLIQQAIDASKNGDTILVDTGTYYENINFKGKSITLKSIKGPEDTIIDGSQKGSVVIFQNMEIDNSILEGFTISNGSGTLSGSYTYGGGIYCEYNSSPTLVHNIINRNKSDHGGGISSRGHSNPNIVKCHIKNNIVTRYGGGVHLDDSDSIIDNCVIEGNRAGIFGGGIKIFGIGTPIISGNKIILNKADEYGGGIEANNDPGPIIDGNIISKNVAGTGAGIHIGDGIVRNNIITDNTAIKYYGTTILGAGGGMYVFGNDPEIVNNTISYNAAMMYGGGIMWSSSYGLIMNNIIFFNCSSGGTAPNDPKAGGGIYLLAPGGGSKIINCHIQNNYSDDVGGGIYVRHYKTVYVTNCSLSANNADYGGAVYCDTNADVHISNSIIYDNGIDEVYYETNMPAITYSNVKGSWPGIGNIDADPHYVDPLKNDYHILFSSPCRDAGDKYAYGISDIDFEGDPRIAFDLPDIGADEFFRHLYYTGSAAPGDGITIKIIGTPKNPTSLFVGKGIIDQPIQTKYGDWYLRFPLDLVLNGDTSWDGILSFDIRIPLSHTDPSNFALQAIVRDNLTNPCMINIK